jgi:acyl carrier protein
MGTLQHEPLDEKVTRLVLEYAQDVPAGPRPLDPALSLRGDLAVDSLSLVSLMVRLGEEFGVLDLEEWGAELANLQTVGDLVGFGKALQRSQETNSLTGT